jgi:hypothetical protein
MRSDSWLMAGIRTNLCAAMDVLCGCSLCIYLFFGHFPLLFTVLLGLTEIHVMLI